MAVEFVSSVRPPVDLVQPASWFLFRGNHLLVDISNGKTDILRLDSPEDIGLKILHREYLGYFTNGVEQQHCFSGEVSADTDPPAGTNFENLRALYSRLDDDHFGIAGRAMQIVEWDRTHQFCGRCSHKTESHPQERSKVCPNCGLTNYPRIAPAIIVRVTRSVNHEADILLARAQRFPTAMFSVLAGFVEVGETLEECVEREIYEEVGIKVNNIQYFGSQPWPFPHSLMIAFTAEYLEGEIHTDTTEIAEAGWFGKNDLPHIPPPPSIANRLITDWIEQATM